MKRLIVAAATVAALAPSVAVADHNHGADDHHAHTAAQTMLTASTPSDGAILAEAPRSLALMFEHPVVLQNLVITGPSGTVNTEFRRSEASAARYTIALPGGLAAGNYQARWSASGEGHQMNGVIRFVVQ